MDGLRRAFLRASSGIFTLAIATAAGLVKSSAARADTWNKSAFESKALADALKNIGASDLIQSTDIVITAPDIAENGAVVPVAVTSKIPGTQSISILAEKNPFPLAASFDISGGTDAYVSTRLKMGQTANVRAVVKAGGKYYTAVKEVKITIGGCG